MMRLTILTASLCLLLTACYDVSYPAQYRCNAGQKTCPDGHRCDEAQGLCVPSTPDQGPPPADLADQGPPADLSDMKQPPVDLPDMTPPADLSDMTPPPVDLPDMTPPPDGPVGPLPDGLKPPTILAAHWRLDETSGQVVQDSSGNNLHGTVNKPSYFTWLSDGMIKGCASFKSNGAHIATPLTPVIDPSGAFSLSAWVKTSDVNTLGVMGFKTTSDGAMELYLETKGGYFLLQDSQNKNVTVKFTQGVQDGAWHHIVVVRDGSKTPKTITIYVDGKQAITGQDPAVGKANAVAKVPFFIGAINSQTGGAQHSFKGYLDDVQVYMHALSPQEIKGLYGQGYWAISMGGTGDDMVNAAATDIKGNTYVTGWGKGKNYHFAGKQITGKGDTDLVVARLAEGDGNSDWVVNFGAPNAQMMGMDIAVDALGNSYITGELVGTVTVGNYVLKPTGKSDAFIVKIAANGSVAWAYLLGGIDKGDGQGITLDGTGGGYIAGSVVQTGKTIPDGFIAKFDSAGALTPCTLVGGALGADTLDDVVADGSGGVWAVGRLESIVTLAGKVRTPLGKTDVLVVKMDSSNKITVAATGGGIGEDVGTAIALDSSGKPTIVGYFTGQGTFDTHPVGAAAVSGQFAFLAQLNTNGSWAMAASPKAGTGSTVGSSRGLDVTVDSAGNIYAAGMFNGTLDFKGASVTSAAGAGDDAFLVKFSSSHTPIWARSASSKGGDEGQGVAVGPASMGNQPVILVGAFGGANGTFGPHSFNPIGSADGFVWRVDGP